MHLAAALDHQPLHAAIGQVGGQPAHRHGVATVDDGRDRPQPRAGVVHARAGAVDELLGLAGGEEVGTRVQLGAAGHGHLHRRRRQPSGDPLVAVGRRAHQQPRVVDANGGRADQDRVAGGADGVDPAEVGIVRQQQPRGRAADVAVDRHAAAEQGVGAFTHRRVRSVWTTAARRRDAAAARGGTHAATSTSAPGRLATSTITP